MLSVILREYFEEHGTNQHTGEMHKTARPVFLHVLQVPAGNT